MKNTVGKRWHGSSVAIHGPALRHIRQLTGLTTRQLADEVDITPDYLRKVELGFNKSVAPNVYAQLNIALRIDDRRVLLADPWPGPIPDSEPSDTPEPEEPTRPEPPARPELDPEPVGDSVQDRMIAQAQRVALRDAREQAS